MHTIKRSLCGPLKSSRHVQGYNIIRFFERVPSRKFRSAHSFTSLFALRIASVSSLELLHASKPMFTSTKYTRANSSDVSLPEHDTTESRKSKLSPWYQLTTWGLCCSLLLSLSLNTMQWGKMYPWAAPESCRSPYSQFFPSAIDCPLGLTCCSGPAN